MFLCRLSRLTRLQGQATIEPQGQQRVEVQGDRNNALTQQQGQIDSAVANSTRQLNQPPLRQCAMAATPRQATTERQTAATPRPGSVSIRLSNRKPRRKRLLAAVQPGVFENKRPRRRQPRSRFASPHRPGQTGFITAEAHENEG